MNVFFVDRAGAASIWKLSGHIARGVLEHGGRATFVIWDDGAGEYEFDVPDGVATIRIPVPRKRRAWDLLRQHAVFARAFRRLLRGERPDVVHTHFAIPSIIARRTAARSGVPCVVSTQHELRDSMSSHLRLGLSLTERHCHAVIYVSRTVASSFGRARPAAQAQPAARQPTHAVIANGVDLAAIQAAIAGVGPRVPGRIVCAGRMVALKGHATLIEALPTALRHHPQLHLRLIGAGPLESRLRQRVAELGLENHVCFTGWQDHASVLREMAQAELVAVPSTQEGYGLVLAEALACGTPLLVSDIPIFHEVLEGAHDWGRYFTAGDAHDLARALSEFRFTSASGQPGRDLAPWSMETMVGAYLDTYRHCLAAGR
jgi:glycosyltransferase involved in cell wall biosynthesis